MKLTVRTFLILVLIGLLFLMTQPSLAQEIQVSAYVSSSQVPLGQSFTLTVETLGTLNVKAPVVEINDCRVQYYGPSSQVSIVNGSKTELIRHVYSLVPTKVGIIEIPMIEVQHQNKTYATRAITVSVVQGNPEFTDRLEEKVFLEVELPKKRVYVNEQIPVTIKLYYQQEVQLQNIHYPEFNLANFLFEKFLEPRRSMEVRNGQYYHLFIFTTNLQPISSGEYDLDSITLQADRLVERQNNRINSFFYSNYDLVPLTVTAAPAVLQVLELPIDGKPADFSGAIGQFDLEVSITPESVQPGEPLTIRSKIFGQGNFNTVMGPIVKSVPQFKYYDQQTVKVVGDSGTTTESREKVFEQVIIPVEAVQEIPPISFSYFDPIKEAYLTIEQPGLAIQMTAQSDSESVVLDYRQRAELNLFGEDILYIKDNLGSVVFTKQLVAPGIIFSGGLLVVVLICGLGFRWWLNRLTPLIKRRQIIKTTTEKKLRNAEKILNSGENLSFYDLLYQIMQSYLKEYYQITITGISEYETRHLLQAGLSPEIIDKIKNFYQKIDQQRFGKEYSTKTDHQQMLLQAKEIINLIARGGVA